VQTILYPFLGIFATVGHLPLSR